MDLSGLNPFATWLAATPPSVLIGNHRWITPAVQSVHILAIGVVMSGMLMVNLRLAGLVGRDEDVREVTRRYLPWIWWFLVVLLVTGSTLIVGEPHRALSNSVFVLKMALLLAAIALTLLVQGPLGADANYWWLPARRPAAKVIALISAIVWVCVVFAGRWIAYSQG